MCCTHTEAAATSNCQLLTMSARLPEEGGFSGGGSEVQSGDIRAAAVQGGVQRAPAGMCRVTADIVGRSLQPRQARSRPLVTAVLAQLGRGRGKYVQLPETTRTLKSDGTAEARSSVSVLS